MARLFGGYDANFTNEIHKRFICDICCKVLCNPHLMLCCGEKFCESCITKWFSRNHSKSCPFCRTGRCHNQLQHTLEKGMKREIESFEVYCSKKELGCKWRGELRNLNKHIQSDTGCGYCKVKCPNNCRTDDGKIMLVLRKDLKEHQSDHCQLRLVSCLFCDHICNMKKYTEHTKTCEYFPVDCPNGCNQFGLIRRDIDIHRGECRLEVVECTNKGCDVKLARENMSFHKKEECKLRLITCNYCKCTCLYLNYDYHLKICPMFPVMCPNMCGDLSIVRSTYRSHRKICNFEIVKCRLGCEEEMCRCDREEHENRKCSFREIQCCYCKQLFTYAELIEHNTVCEMYPLTCPNGCEETGIIRKMLVNHRQVCRLEVIECKYAYGGCNKKVKRKLMPQHEREAQKQHLDMMTEAHLSATTRLQEMIESSMSREKNLKESQNKLAEKEIKLDETSLQLRKVTKKLNNIIPMAGNLQEQLGKERQRNAVLQEQLGKERQRNAVLQKKVNAIESYEIF